MAQHMPTSAGRVASFGNDSIGSLTVLIHELHSIILHHERRTGKKIKKANLARS